MTTLTTSFITNQFNQYFAVHAPISLPLLEQCLSHKTESDMHNYIQTTLNFSRCSVMFFNTIIKCDPLNVDDIYWVDHRGYKHDITLNNQTIEHWISHHQSQ